MAFPIQIHALRMGLSIIYIRGHKLKFPNYDVFMSLKIVLTSTKSVDPGEMQHYAAFHLGLHFLLSTPLGVSRIQSVNVW